MKDPKAEQKNGATSDETSEQTDAEAPAPNPRTSDAILLNGGLTLTVPAEYAGLLLTDTPRSDEDARSVGNFRFYMNYLYRDVTFEAAALPALDADAVELAFDGGDRLLFWEGTNYVRWVPGGWRCELVGTGW